MNTEVGEDLGSRAVVARVCRQAQLEVRIDGVASAILEFIGTELVEEPDSPALVPTHVEDDAPAFVRNAAKGGLKLRTAVTSE